MDRRTFLRWTGHGQDLWGRHGRVVIERPLERLVVPASRPEEEMDVSILFPVRRLFNLDRDRQLGDRLPSRS